MRKTIKVNGQVIPEEAVNFEFERLVRFYMEHGWSQEQVKASLPELVRQAQEQAVGAKLLLDEAARLDIAVSEEEVERQIGDVVEQVGGPDAFVRALEAQGTTEARFREQMRQGKRVDKLIAQATAGVDEPTESDIEAYFAEHKAEFAKGERMLAQHILITPDGDTDHAKQEALGAIRAILGRVRGGASFSDEAAAHSMCPSGKDGGSLGWFGRGMMVPEFDKAAFAMRVGDVSDVIETQFGYHIIKKTDREDGGEATLDDAREQVRDLIRHARRGAAVTRYVGELKAKALIETL